MLRIAALLIFSLSCAETKYRIQRPFLYEVTKGQERAWLFGTIHYGVSSADLPEEFWRYLNSAEHFMAERVVRDRGDKKIEEEYYKRLIRKATEPKLCQALGPELHPQWLAAMIEKKMTMQQDGKAVPITHALADWLTPLGAHHLTSQATGTKLNYYSKGLATGNRHRLMHSRLDWELVEKATAQQKSLEPLDIDEDSYYDCVISAFYGDQVTLKENIGKMLQGKSFVSKLDSLVELLDIYRGGDERQIEGIKIVEECVLDGRNKKWLPLIQRAMRTKKGTFVVMGVAHLHHPGMTVLKLLRAQGYAIRRIHFPTEQ